MNPMADKYITGTIGELLVQIRLLEYLVQAAPPLRDTGNDLIALRNRCVKSISVRTTRVDTYNRPDEGRIYDLLAVVALKPKDCHALLDQTVIFLLPAAEAAKRPNTLKALVGYELTEKLVYELFPDPEPPKEALIMSVLSPEARKT